MKRTLLLVFLHLVVGVMSYDANFINKWMFGLPLTREEVETCVNRTGVTVEDMMNFDQVMEDGPQSTDYSDRILKVGCLATCLAQQKEMMTGAKIQVDKIRDLYYTVDTQAGFDPTSEQYIAFIQRLKTCEDEVKHMTNECQVSLAFMLCYRNKGQQHRHE